MRITGGKYKGKTIQTVKGQVVRPTSSKVRESIFNIIQLSEFGTVFYEGETVMLDLFAGSGIMGLEALFVEKNSRHAEIVKKNIQNTYDMEFFANNTKLVISDAIKFLNKTAEKFNFIFVDPPYASGIYDEVLNTIKNAKILESQGIIVLEHSSGMDMQKIIEMIGFSIYKTKIYGDTGITILHF